MGLTWNHVDTGFVTGTRHRKITILECSNFVAHTSGIVPECVAKINKGLGRPARPGRRVNVVKVQIKEIFFT